jgi:hypothetical protein
MVKTNNMKSRITIDVDYDNQPIIKVEYTESDDVRDKLVKKFMESFGTQSYLATFYYEGTVKTPNSLAIVRPLPAKEFHYHQDFIKAIVQKEKDESQPMNLTTKV